MKAHVLSSCIVALALAASTGCYVRAGTRPAETESAVVYTEPPAAPPPQPEVQPASPGPDFEWVAGVHRWNGRSYDWVGGHYERRPHANARHVAAHWEQRGRGEVWVDAHWE